MADHIFLHITSFMQQHIRHFWTHLVVRGGPFTGKFCHQRIRKAFTIPSWMPIQNVFSESDFPVAILAVSHRHRFLPNNSLLN
jgi:hypothetical protein